MNHYKCEGLAEGNAVCQIYKIQRHTNTLEHTYGISNGGALRGRGHLRWDWKGEWGSARWKGQGREVVWAEGESNTCKGSEVRKAWYL